MRCIRVEMENAEDFGLRRVIGKMAFSIAHSTSIYFRITTVDYYQEAAASE